MIVVFVFLILLLVWLIALNMSLFIPSLRNETSLEQKNPFTTDSDDDPAWGDPGAKITIIAFQDFTCPACGQSYPNIKKLRENYWDKVYFVFRDFPIISTESTVAALASECAHEQGKYWEMHDKLFENQNLISSEYVRLFASQLGLDVDTFNQCLDSGKYENEVKNDFNEGFAAGAMATPTWFINGTKFEGAFNYEFWEKLINGFY